jgi:hypothetical protein
MEPQFHCLTIPTHKKERWSKAINQIIIWIRGFRAAGGEVEADLSRLGDIEAAINSAYTTCPPKDEVKVSPGQIIATAGEPCKDTKPSKITCVLLALDGNGNPIAFRTPDGQESLIVADRTWMGNVARFTTAP